MKQLTRLTLSLVATASILSTSASSFDPKDLKGGIRIAYEATGEVGCPQYVNRYCVGDWVAVHGRPALIVRTGKGGSTITSGPKIVEVSNEIIQAKSVATWGSGSETKITWSWRGITDRYPSFTFVSPLMRFHEKGGKLFGVWVPRSAKYHDGWEAIYYGKFLSPKDFIEGYAGPVL